MRETRTEVLVVGAGPIGLWTTLLLAKAGVEASLIDREERTTARSYACALHPRTLELLQRHGLADPLLAQGRRVDTIAFYDGESRQAEVRLSKLGGEFPFLLILPQAALESILEQRLRKAGVAVHWNHRFDSFSSEDELVAATVEELGGTGTGYIVPHWEMTVKRRSVVQAQFVVGADGHDSLVRQRVGLEFQRVSPPQLFAAYEFECSEPTLDEVRVVLDEATTNVLWPLGEHKYRWTFQLVQSEFAGGFPQKERRAARVAQPMVDERIRQYVQKVAHHRAPWFSATVKDIAWCSEIAFEQRLVQQFGRDRCWLAGDAAHQTGPVGVQSMNLGFCEADCLAGTLRKILRENAPLSLLKSYDHAHQAEWCLLLGLSGELQSKSGVDPWTARRISRLLPCLPATGKDLARLSEQLGLRLSQAPDTQSIMK
jgi:2-polyprenyl-6-methoxyphenol hydroxylase-like FAD-dependent oxidoreductase